MKRLSLLLMLASIVFLSSCSSSEEPAVEYNFEEQVAQGQIEGEAWTFDAGKANLTEDQDGNLIYSINMYSNQESITDVCSLFGADFDEILFSLPAEVGLYELSFDLSSSSAETVTLFDRENTMSIIATEGAVEILTVTDTQITGRADIRYDNINFINGNFTLDICQ